MDNCKDITHMISEGLDRRLSWMERLRVRAHLMMCGACTNFDRQMAVLRAASRAFRDHLSDREKS